MTGCFQYVFFIVYIVYVAVCGNEIFQVFSGYLLRIWLFLSLITCLCVASGKIECALFGLYVDNLLKLMGKAVSGMPVVVLQFVKVKIFQGRFVLVCY
jgi:hypothetical protein